MGRDVSRTISSYFTAKGAALTLSFDVSVVVKELINILEKKLLKKGIALRWTDEHDSSDLLIRIVEINQGNQFLRWLLPFAGPAVLEVEGQVSAAGTRPQSFHYVQKAHFGLAGGSPQSMLKVCVMRIAKKIIRDIRNTLKI